MLPPNCSSPPTISQAFSPLKSAMQYHLVHWERQSPLHHFLHDRPPMAGTSHHLLPSIQWNNLHHSLQSYPAPLPGQILLHTHSVASFFLLMYTCTESLFRVCVACARKRGGEKTPFVTVGRFLCSTLQCQCNQSD